MRWGFLGTGRVTGRMVNAVRVAKNATLVAVASRSVERAKSWLSEHYPNDASIASAITVYDGYQALLDDDSIDGVYIALPPNLHHEWTLKSLATGKNVLSEKPLCLNYSEANDIRNAARKADRIVSDATAYPFHPRSTASRAIVRSGELGEIRRVHVACSFSEIFRRGPDHRTDPKLGGGCLLDLGWYCVHTTLWMTGLKCKAVQAVGEKRNGVWNHVQVLAELDNGAVAHWDCGFDAAGRKWMEIAGSEGSWICDDLMRPWNLAQPRFWIHGTGGKARAEIHGTDVFQEAIMIEQFDDPGQVQPDSLSLAVECHRILDAIETSLGGGRVQLD